jgi:hypothetical protein
VYRVRGGAWGSIGGFIAGHKKYDNNSVMCTLFRFLKPIVYQQAIKGKVLRDFHKCCRAGAAMQ